MLKKLGLGAALVALATLGGCTFDRDHNLAHWRGFKQDVHKMHRFIDRHFFNYDEEDPDRY
ncbi:MAG: hypothetical protein HYZ53_18870 [Planctomycetes bacterium]|nr:hypothetical protein [Planctomycetota bacterium]